MENLIPKIFDTPTIVIGILLIIIVFIYRINKGTFNIRFFINARYNFFVKIVSTIILPIGGYILLCRIFSVEYYWPFEYFKEYIKELSLKEMMSSKPMWKFSLFYVLNMINIINWIPIIWERQNEENGQIELSQRAYTTSAEGLSILKNQKD
jgi:hypothetical protein